MFKHFSVSIFIVFSLILNIYAYRSNEAQEENKAEKNF